MDESERRPFAEWAILELMGHRRLAGFLTEQEIGGGSFLRIDVPSSESMPAATQFYSHAAVYAITPTTEEIARRIAEQDRPMPVNHWELAAAKPSRTVHEAQVLPLARVRDDDDRDEDDLADVPF